MNHLKKSTFLFCFLLVNMFGCQTDKSGDISESQVPTSTEESSLLAEQTFSDINSFADKFLTTSGLKSQTVETCPTVIWNLSALPFSIALDWGTGCIGADNIFRKGKITGSLTAKMNVLNAVATFTFDNFYTEGYKITGVHKITYKGFNTGTTNPRYSVLTEARIDFPNQKFMTYRSDYWRILAEGAATITQEDDVWRIEGNSSGVTAEGLNWIAIVNSAIVKSSKCRWISKGIMMITPKDLPEYKVDFGDGSCDNKVTVTKDEKTLIIEMK